MSGDHISARRTARYARLEPAIRRVSRTAIQKKWRKLPESSQSRLRDVFRSIEKPPVPHKAKDGKGLEVQRVVDMAVELLEKRLPRMPFPPKTVDTDFDFEAIIDRKRSLDTQLTSHTHAIKLLETEIAREEGFLAEEEAELERLQRDLKTNDILRKRRAKNAHPLASNFTNVASEIFDTTDKIYCADATAASSGPSSNDPLLIPLVAQLNDHLNSGIRPLYRLDISQIGRAYVPDVRKKPGILVKVSTAASLFQHYQKRCNNADY